jgi:hypothetical protein
VAALHGEPTAARHRRTGDDRGNGRLTGTGTAARRDSDVRAVRRPGWHGGGPGDAASDRGGRDARYRGGGARGKTAGGRCEAVGRRARGARRRAVPTALLMRGSCAARGNHAATARCRAGQAWHAASDRWDPLVSDF